MSAAPKLTAAQRRLLTRAAADPGGRASWYGRGDARTVRSLERRGLGTSMTAGGFRINDAGRAAIAGRQL